MRFQNDDGKVFYESDRARKAVSYESLRDIAAAHGARPDAWDLLAERMTNANITGAYQRAFAGRTPLLWLARIGGFLLAAVSIGVAIQTVYVCFATHNYLPQDDEWRNLDIFRSIVNNGQIIKNLFGQHNEHRIFFPKLVMFSDYLFFDGRNILNLIVIFAIQTLEAILFLVLLWRSRPSAEGAVAVGAMIVMLLFSMRQSENFVWGFQVQFVGVFACASLAIVLFVMSLSARSQGRSFALMSAAYALTAISTFSMANGLMSGVALIIIAVLARARARTIILTTALTVILGGLFLFDYQFGDSHAIVGAVRRPFQVLTFTAAYLGNFLIFDVDHAALLGFCGLVATAAMGMRVAMGRDKDPTRLALLGIALFVAGSAFITALGRSPDGLQGAGSGRYATGAAVFWCATLINGWSLSGALRQPIPLRLLTALAAAILLHAVLSLQQRTVLEIEQRQVAINAIADSLLQGLNDDAAMAAMDEPPELVRSLVPFMRDRDLSIFSERDARAFGAPLSEVGVLETHNCAGAFNAAVPAPELGENGVRISGASGVRHRWRFARRVYVADHGGKVIGFASTAVGGGDWMGYATAAPGADLHAYTMTKSGGLCDIGSAVVSPAATEKPPVSGNPP